jgi:hypothetical protein
MLVRGTRLRQFSTWMDLSRSLSGIDLLFLRFRNATMWIGISLVAGDRSKQVVAIQERCNIELLRRLEN